MLKQRHPPIYTDRVGRTGSEPTIALSSAAEVQAVATLTEQAWAFTDQLSRAQRDTSVGLILMCTAMLSVYALFGVMA